MELLTAFWLPCGVSKQGIRWGSLFPARSSRTNGTLVRKATCGHLLSECVLCVLLAWMCEFLHDSLTSAFLSVIQLGLLVYLGNGYIYLLFYWLSHLLLSQIHTKILSKLSTKLHIIIWNRKLGCQLGNWQGLNGDHLASFPFFSSFWVIWL